jgi:mono/diheme cytochrome c family protein
VLAKCVDCHGQDLGGATMIDDAAFARMAAPNLTTGRGGVLATYDDAALEAAIRHGVGSDGRRLMIMPSNEYQFLSDEDLGAIVAYIRSLPAVDRSFSPPALGPIARMLSFTGALPLFPHDAVTHGAVVVASVPVDTTVAYGEYIGSIGCSGCHGMGYGGGKIPGTPPDWPPPANITRTGIGHYTFADFQKALTDGVRPDGSAINPFMPIAATKDMTVVEMQAVWNYLRSIPAREFGTR